MNFLLAFGLSLFLTYFVISLTRRFDLVYKPQQDRWNTRVVSLHGGIAIWSSFLIGLIFLGEVQMSEKWITILAGTTGMMFLGLYDDLYTVSPKVKLWAQTLLTTLALCSGVMFVFSDYFIVNAVLSFLWIVGITNAVNLVDNMDGASSGLLLITLLSLAYLPHHVEAHHVAIAMTLAGALLGFLCFNFNPSKIFMGDSGSLALGSFTALLLLDFSQTLNPTITHTAFQVPSALLIPALLIFVPILDTTFVTINRKLNGYAVSQGDRGHIAHRLSFLFNSDRMAVGILYLYQGIISAIIASYFWELLYPVVAVTLLLLYLITCVTNHKVWPEKFTEFQWPKLLPHKFTEKLLDYKGFNQELFLEKEASLAVSGASDK